MDKPNVWLALIAVCKNESARCDTQTFTALHSVFSCYQQLTTQHYHSTWSFKIDDGCNMVFLVLIDIKFANQAFTNLYQPSLSPHQEPYSRSNLGCLSRSLYIICRQRRDTEGRLRDLHPTRYPPRRGIATVLGISAED